MEGRNGPLITCAQLRNSRSTGCPEALVEAGIRCQALRVSWVIGAYVVSPCVAHVLHTRVLRPPLWKFRRLRWEFGPIRWREGRCAPSRSVRRSAISDKRSAIEDRPLAECRACVALAGGQAWASVPRYSSMTFGSFARFLPVPVYAFLPWSRT